MSSRSIKHARITNSVIENNSNGIGGQGPLDRFGRGYNLPATIFVRGAQPIIVNNIIRDNVNPPLSDFNPANGLGARDNAAITINVNSLNNQLLSDLGRSTGFIDQLDGFGDNRGPLVRDNRLDGNGLNGMVVRGEEITTQSVWDDTDIVHMSPIVMTTRGLAGCSTKSSFPICTPTAAYGCKARSARVWSSSWKTTSSRPDNDST